MKLIFISGNHHRHYFVANQMSKLFDQVIWIKEKREKFIPNVSKNINNKLKKLSKLHFLKRKTAEEKHFKDKNNYKYKNIKKKLIINRKDFKKKIFNILENIGYADFLISYGCSKFPSKVFENKKIKNFWNIHGGLTPNYRGSITNFWPSYFLEPQKTGMTLHILNKNIDGGDVIFQTDCKLNIKDGLHDLNCKAIINFCKKFKKKIPIIYKKKIKGIKIKTNGKIWSKSDWHEKHLIVIYDKFNDKIIDYCKRNNLLKDKPRLIDNIKY